MKSRAMKSRSNIRMRVTLGGINYKCRRNSGSRGSCNRGSLKRGVMKSRKSSRALWKA